MVRKLKEELCQRSIDWTSKADQLRGDELLLLKAGLFVGVVVCAREGAGRERGERDVLCGGMAERERGKV